MVNHSISLIARIAFSILATFSFMSFSNAERDNTQVGTGSALQESSAENISGVNLPEENSGLCDYITSDILGANKSATNSSESTAGSSTGVFTGNDSTNKAAESSISCGQNYINLNTGNKFYTPGKIYVNSGGIPAVQNNNLSNNFSPNDEIVQTKIINTNDETYVVFPQSRFTNDKAEQQINIQLVDRESVPSDVESVTSIPKKNGWANAYVVIDSSNELTAGDNIYSDVLTPSPLGDVASSPNSDATSSSGVMSPDATGGLLGDIADQVINMNDSQLVTFYGLVNQLVKRTSTVAPLNNKPSLSNDWEK